MNARLFLMGACLAGLVGLVSCGAGGDGLPISPEAASRAKLDPGLTDRLDQAVTAYRRSNGEKAVPHHSGLDRLAREHALALAATGMNFKDMSTKIRHSGFEARMDQARRFYGMTTVAENVGGGRMSRDQAPSWLLNAWTKSNDNQLRGKWDATGLGVAIGENGNVYATQIFGSAGLATHAVRDDFARFQ